MAVLITTAMRIGARGKRKWLSQRKKRSAEKAAQFESLLTALFRRVGWRVARSSRNWQTSSLVEAGEKKYIVRLKQSPEGRRDRLIPLLSQAILEARAAARGSSEPVIPVAVVAATRIPDSVGEQVKQFALDYAAEMGIGLVDSEGFRSFAGHGLEVLSGPRSVSPRVELSARSRPQLFSDLNQWMLKVLLSPALKESLLSTPRGLYVNASQLAQAAGVSVMSAFRLVRALSKEGFLDERAGWLRLVRIEELMKRWLAANQEAVSEIPLRWVIRGSQNQLSDAIRSYVAQIHEKAALRRSSRADRILGPAPRVCVALFAAADMHGIGFVRGVQPHVYLERFDAAALRRLGLAAENTEGNADVCVRIPKRHESVFRASVVRNGLPVSDILQVWLDVSNHPARGKEQADQIWNRILAPFFHKFRR